MINKFVWLLTCKRRSIGSNTLPLSRHDLLIKADSGQTIMKSYYLNRITIIWILFFWTLMTKSKKKNRQNSYVVKNVVMIFHSCNLAKTVKNPWGFCSDIFRARILQLDRTVRIPWVGFIDIPFVHSTQTPASWPFA